MMSRSDAWVSEWPPSRPRPSTTSSPSGEAAVRLLELADRGLAERDERAFGDPRIALGDIERIAAPVDQLDAEREAPLVDQPPHAVERRRHRDGRAWRRRAARQTRPRRGGIAKLDASNRPSNSSGRRAELVGQRRRMREDLGEQPRQRRPRLEQAEEIDAARQPLDDVAQAVERVVGIGARGDRLQQAGSIASNACCAGRRAKRARLTRTPVGDVPRRPSGSANPSAAARRAGCRDRSDSCRRSSGARLSKMRADALDMRPKQRRSAPRRSPGRAAARHCRARRLRAEAGASVRRRPSARDARSVRSSR